MPDTPPVLPYETPPQPIPKRRDPLALWFAADALLFIAWLAAYMAVTPWQMADPHASDGEKMLVLLLFVAASSLFVIVTTCWLVRKLRRKERE